MLVLSRDIENEVVISHRGEEIRIKILDIANKQVKLGFDGKQFKVLRAEMIKQKEVDDNVGNKL